MADPVKNREEQIEAPESHEPEAPEATTENEPVVDVQRQGDDFVVSGEPALSRRERRAKERQEQLAAVFDERSKPLVEQIGQLRQTLHSLAATLGQQNRQTMPQPPQEPESPSPAGNKEEWLSLRKRQGHLQKLMETAPDVDTLHEYQNEWYDLDFKAAQMVARTETEGLRSRIIKDIPQPQEPYQLQVLKAEFPDVFAAGPQAMSMTQAHFILEDQNARSSGQPYNEMEVHRKALSRTAEALGLRRRPSSPINPTQQARFAGVAPGSPGGGNGTTSRPLTHDEKAVARAFASTMNPGASDEEAFKLWSSAMVKADPNFFRSK